MRHQGSRPARAPRRMPALLMARAPSLLYASAFNRRFEGQSSAIMRAPPALRSPISTERIFGDRAARFRHLTFPRLGARIEQIAPPWFLIGAWVDDEPAGLMMAGPGVTAADMLLKSVSVAPSFRRRGIGRHLLQELETEARARKVSRIAARFVPTMKLAEAFVSLTSHLKWERPSTVSLNLTGEAGLMAQSGGEWPGVKTWLSDPGEFTFEPWRPLTVADEEAMARLRAQSAFRSYLEFTGFAAAIDPACSLHIRRSGALLGWIAATPFQGAMVARYGNRIGRHYRSAYVDESLWRSAALIAGYYHAFSRQGETYGNDSIATYFTDFPGQMALTRRRFASMALSMEEIREVAKTLQPG